MPIFSHRYSPPHCTKFYKEYRKYRSQTALIAIEKGGEALKPLASEMVGFLINNKFVRRYIDIWAQNLLDYLLDDLLED